MRERILLISTCTPPVIRGEFGAGLETVTASLLCGALLLRNDSETASEVIDHGLSIVGRNSKRFFEAELY
jgi:hypothetical protein